METVQGQETIQSPEEPPMVPCKRGEGWEIIFTKPCPYCRRKHVHGIGKARGRVRGHRKAHCPGNPPPAGSEKGYVLYLE